MSDTEKTNGSLALTPRIITIQAKEPERTRELRVAAYARVSSNSEDQKHSFAAQNAYYSKLITDNPDWELADIYADQGITGTSIDKRDDFLRMMEDCRKGRIDRILVKSSSRFARNAKESLEAVRELAALGMNLHGGSASVDELNALDGKGTARQLIESGSGTITPYGVVYDKIDEFLEELERDHGIQLKRLPVTSVIAV